MSDFGKFIEKKTSSFFKDKLFDDFILKELSPLSHLKETDSSWVLRIDLPLVDKKDIKITLSKNHLTVKAKLQKKYKVSRGSTVSEFEYFKKTVTVPAGIIEDKISAQFKNGILRITLPKIATGKNISIE